MRWSPRGERLLLIGMRMTSAREQAGGVVVVHGEEHGGCGEFAAMQMVLVPLPAPLLLVPVDVEEYGTGASYLRGHEPRHDEEEAEAVAVCE